MITNEEWNIVYYKNSDGDSPVYKFINSLEEKAKSKIVNTFDLLESYGTRLGSHHVKKVTGTPFWELRILGKDNIRFFYTATKRQTFLLLHGFIKKSQKIPTKEIKLALTRLKYYERIST